MAPVLPTRSSEVSDSRLLIGQLAARVGMAPSALRYYEDAGLLTPTERTAAGYRVYGPEVIARIRFIQLASALGLKLTEIRHLIESARGQADERSLLRAVISRKIEETRSKMAELTSRAGELLKVERRLRRQALPDYCHLGDCTCWFQGAS
jgi:DNA-binding transcriptional MerR regulator